MSQRTGVRATIFAAGLLLTLGVTVHRPPAATYGFGAPGHNVQVSHDNVQVSHDAFAAHAEPSLAVNPRRPHNLLGAAQLIASTRESAVLGTFFSQDGGHTWHDNGPLAMPAGYTHGDDVTVAFSAQGTGLVAAEVYGNQGSAVVVWRSTDDGRHFAPPLLVYHAAESTDHPWIATSPAGAHVYLAWSARPILLFSASDDDGRAFSAPLTISGPDDQLPDLAVVTAGPAQTVHVVYDGGHGPFEVVGSSDGGRTFGAPQTPSGASLAGGPSTLAVSTLLATATDPRRGIVYVARAAYLSRTQHLIILLWRSSVAGRSWPAPVRVDDEPGAILSDHFQPQLAVDNTSAVDLTYLAMAGRRIAVYLSRYAPLNARVALNRRVSTASFDPMLGIKGGKGGPWWIGDYQGLATGPGVVYPFWNDTRTGRLEIFTAAVPISAGHRP